jgi:hypothetical protein
MQSGRLRTRALAPELKSVILDRPLDDLARKLVGRIAIRPDHTL